MPAAPPATASGLRTLSEVVRQQNAVFIYPLKQPKHTASQKPNDSKLRGVSSCCESSSCSRDSLRYFYQTPSLVNQHTADKTQWPQYLRILYIGQPIVDWTQTIRPQWVQSTGQVELLVGAAIGLVLMTFPLPMMLRTVAIAASKIPGDIHSKYIEVFYTLKMDSRNIFVLNLLD